MSAGVDASGLQRLIRRVDTLRDRFSVTSPVQRRAQADFQKIVQDGHEHALNTGVDRDGKPVAPLKPSTREHRDGAGPPRVPPPASRPVQGLELHWEQQGPNTVVLVGSYRFPWMRYHDAGTRHMAARRMDGITPDTRQKLAVRLRQLTEDIVRP